MEKLKNKNGIFYVVISFLAVLGVASLVYAYSIPQNINVSGDYNYYEAEGQPEEVNFGASSGPDHFFPQRFHSNFSVGGEYYATTTGGGLTAYTLTNTELAADFSTSFLDINPGNDLTLTTMASTSAPLVNLNVGEFYSVYMRNSSTTAAVITLAAGTGVDLQEDEGETVTVNNGEISRLTFLKGTTTDVIAWLEVGQIGD